MIKGQMSFRNEKQVSFLAKNIGHNFANRGFSWSSKIETVLRDLQENHALNTLKKLDEEKISEYVEELKESVENGDIKAETAQTYISAMNTIIDYTNTVNNTNFQAISASQHGINANVDYYDKSISPEVHQSFQSFLQEKHQEIKDEKYQALQHAVKLQRELGLRFRESAGLNIKTIEKAIKTGNLELSRQDWTKNARERTIEIQIPEQRFTLEKTKDFLKDSGKNNLAGGKDWKEHKPISSFRNFADRVRQDFNNQKKEQYSFHGERHHWAQSQYSAKWEQKTGIEIQSPIKYYSEQLEANGWNGSGKFYHAVKNFEIKSFSDYVQEQTGIDNFREIDKEIRLLISEELGHSRLDITNTYLGHP